MSCLAVVSVKPQWDPEGPATAPHPPAPSRQQFWMPRRELESSPVFLGSELGPDSRGRVSSFLPKLPSETTEHGSWGPPPFLGCVPVGN